MINLTEVSTYVLAKGNEGLLLEGAKRREVRLELNTAGPCQLRIQYNQNDIRFLANVHGRETITFIADGNVVVYPDSEDEVWWWTPEMEKTSVVIPDAETFTKLAERRQRNPELERVAKKMAENADRRMSMMFAEFDRRVAAAEAKNATLTEEIKKRGKPKDVALEPAGGKQEKKGKTPAPEPHGGVDSVEGGTDE